ncbi:hypothetical protein TNCV_954511 [Trichonephila clavipes]|nr:hypothetical protein TNCV_954511 [Trichonephila clavipes]
MLQNKVAERVVMITTGTHKFPFYRNHDMWPVYLKDKAEDEACSSPLLLIFFIVCNCFVIASDFNECYA